MSRVIIYTQDGCTACHQEMAWLSQHGVAFEERNIRRDRRYLEELQALGAMATPVTVIDGRTVVGFDQEQLRAALNL